MLTMVYCRLGLAAVRSCGSRGFRLRRGHAGCGRPGATTLTNPEASWRGHHDGGIDGDRAGDRDDVGSRGGIAGEGLHIDRRPGICGAFGRDARTAR